MAAARSSAVAANATRPPPPSQRAAAQHAHAPRPAASTRAYTPPSTIHVHVAKDPVAPSAATTAASVDLVALRTVPKRPSPSSDIATKPMTMSVAGAPMSFVSGAVTRYGSSG